ncbi:MAG: hypothetical protein ACRYGP_29190 [Janthinobacterium lividum]
MVFKTEGEKLMPFMRVGNLVVNTAEVKHVEEVPSSMAERKRNSPDLLLTMRDGTQIRGYGRITEWEGLDQPVVPASMASGSHTVLTMWPPSEPGGEWYCKSWPVLAWRIALDGMCEPLVADDSGDGFRALLLPDGTVDVAYDRSYDSEEEWRTDVRKQHAARLAEKENGAPKASAPTAS